MLQTIRHGLAISLLLAVILGAFVTTLALSPVRLGPADNQVAGLDTQEGEVVSNFIPLAFTDLSTNLPQYQSQLVKLNPDIYNYFVKFSLGSKLYLSAPFVLVRNDNFAPVSITVTAQVPQNLQTSLRVFLRTKERTFALDAQGAKVSIPANTSLELGVDYEAKRPINFGIDVAFQITR